MNKRNLSLFKRIQLYFSLNKFFRTVKSMYGWQWKQEPLSITEKEQRYETLKLCRSLLAIHHKRIPVEEAVLECLELFCESSDETVNEAHMVIMSHFIVLRDKYYSGR